MFLKGKKKGRGMRDEGRGMKPSFNQLPQKRRSSAESLPSTNDKGQITTWLKINALFEFDTTISIVFMTKYFRVYVS